MNVKKSTVCNINKDEDYYKRDTNICKYCYNIKRKKNTNNTFSRNDNNKKKQKSLTL